VRTGDLNGNGFDEIVLVYADMQDSLQIRVYEVNTDLQLVEIARHSEGRLLSLDAGILSLYTRFIVETADLNGDGRDEIIVGYVFNQSMNTSVSVYSAFYTLDGTSLTHAGGFTQWYAIPGGQGVEYLFIRSRELKREIGKQYRRAWTIYGGLGRLVYGRHEGTRKILDAVQWQVDHFEDVPVLVVVAQRGISFPLPWILRSSRYGSVYPAVQNFLLAARAEGLGAALTTLPLWNQLAIDLLLNPHKPRSDCMHDKADVLLLDSATP
jgi:hypothetical protein